MKSLLAAFERAAEWLDRDDPQEPAYDPVHLGCVLIANLVVVGALYWLLWTLLVYEGGIFSKIAALASASRGPDAFDGWLANACALLLAVGAVGGLHGLYRRAASAARR